MTSFLNKQLIKPIIFLLAYVVIIYFVIYPTIIFIIDASNKLEINRNEIAEKMAISNELQKVQKILPEIKPILNEMEKIFIIRKSELNFITSIESLAEKTNVDIKINPDFNGKKITDSIFQSNINIGASGKYIDLLNFLKSLENQNYFIEIETLSFSAASEKTNMVLTGQIYIKDYGTNNK